MWSGPHTDALNMRYNRGAIVTSRTCEAKFPMNSTENFADRLQSAIIQRRTPLIVGIDPRFENLPKTLRDARDQRASGTLTTLEASAWAYEEFSRGIVDVVASLVAAIKPQIAFFEALGPAGLAALSRVIDYAQQAGLLVVMDAKRNDIGTTAAAYAAAYLGRKPKSVWGCDALTVNPSMGFDTLQPFVEQARNTGSGIFVLVKTSNPGSGDLQELRVGDDFVYQRIADRVERFACESCGKLSYGAIGAVVGATYPEQLEELRQRMKHTLFLVPGFGAQGGTAADVAGAFDERGLGALINSSRGIIFAYDQPAFRGSNPRDWQRSVELATSDAIERLATDTRAGNLRDSRPY